MRLFYVPGVCSLTPHIVLREGQFQFTLDKLDLQAGKKTEKGEDYLTLNPKGYVPALQLPDGRVLTEVAVMVQYLADLKPGSGLAPALGTFERYQLMECLNFIATELHKGMSMFYQPLASDELKAVLRKRLTARFDVLGAQVEGHRWLYGETFTVADAYAVYVLRAYQKQVKFDLTKKPTLNAYYQRLVERPSVKAALLAEQLEP